MAIKGRDCKTCKFDVDGVYCESHTYNCNDCIHLDENCRCKCIGVNYGEECPHYAVKED